MKNVIELRKLFFVCMVVGSTVVLSSCSDDDDEKIPAPPSVTDVNGDYSGKMLVTPLEVPAPAAENEEPAGTDIAAIVKSDTVYFNDFPISDLVAAIIGEENAPAIIEKIGKVNYKVGFKSDFNAAQDSIFMTFDPKPLTIALPGEGEEVTNVEVTISVAKKGSYELSSKKLVFDLNADKVTLGEVEIPAFKASEFAFKLNKK